MISSPLINVMSAAAIKAGKGLLRDFGEVDQLQVSRKGPANFVTKADLRTEKLLQRELSKARPGYSFLLEEGGDIPGEDATWRWIIDPLDGTSNFIHAVPYFCVSIALEKRDGENREIVAGVIFDPLHNELFTAEKNKGAFLNNRRLAVSTRVQLEDTMLATGSPRHSSQSEGDTASMVRAIAKCGATVRCFGATALDLAHLAAGRLDACWYYTFQPWDVAAGMLMVREAGGNVTDLSGQPFTISSKALLAANHSLFLPMQKLLSQAA